ncbi:Na+/H+ antiporter subunit E [Xanthobacter sp. DSM 24535]|uniref:Na+/H+ antiporter subunit E n=1 Tax=Roseixanthobacter psychrophilus TaxID=3119917 RepID=UPI00372974AA
MGSERAENATPPQAKPPRSGAAFCYRWLIFFLAWVMLGRISAVDLVAGAAAAALAAGASLAVLPAGRPHVRPAALPAFALRFVHRSLVAGWDVAGRAVRSPLPLHPGLITFATLCPRGLERQMFCAITSLQPGTLPLGETGGVLELHCLDTASGVREDLQHDEAAYRAAFGGGTRDG